MKKVMIIGLIGVTALNGMNEQIVPVDKKYDISRESYKQYYKELPSKSILNTMDMYDMRVRELDQKKPLPLFVIDNHKHPFVLKPVNVKNIDFFDDLPRLLSSGDLTPYIDAQRCVGMVTGFERVWLLENKADNQACSSCIGTIMYAPICPRNWCGEDQKACTILGNKKVLEIEYYLRREGRGHGIMSAAVAELINFIKHFETGNDGYDYVIAGIPAGNEKSKAVVKRTGFTCISDQQYRSTWAYQLQ